MTQVKLDQTSRGSHRGVRPVIRRDPKGWCRSRTWANFEAKSLKFRVFRCKSWKFDVTFVSHISTLWPQLEVIPLHPCSMVGSAILPTTRHWHQGIEIMIYQHHGVHQKNHWLKLSMVNMVICLNQIPLGFLCSLVWLQQHPDMTESNAAENIWKLVGVSIHIESGCFSNNCSNFYTCRNHIFDHCWYTVGISMLIIIFGKTKSALEHPQPNITSHIISLQMKQIMPERWWNYFYDLRICHKNHPKPNLNVVPWFPFNVPQRNPTQLEKKGSHGIGTVSKPWDCQKAWGTRGVKTIYTAIWAFSNWIDHTTLYSLR